MFHSESELMALRHEVVLLLLKVVPVWSHLLQDNENLKRTLKSLALK